MSKVATERTREKCEGLMRCIIVPIVLSIVGMSITPSWAAPERERWRVEAANVSIVRDDWGIAHVRGKSDADAVFGMIYAQAEDDFTRIETNYIEALGRLAEIQGEGAIYKDLRMKLFVDPIDLQSKYLSSPPVLKELMDAWADGLNFYLAVHPAVRPRLIRRFEPWMVLSFTEGSVGNDITRISVDDLRSFYGGIRRTASVLDVEAYPPDPSGSNGIAIAPSKTLGHHALLLINPHTSFFFRSELQMTSDRGLNVYGAVTWGQPFVYQGFNDHVGWMHTSSGVDAVDYFAETIVRRAGRLYYRYGSEERPITTSRIAVPYRDASGASGCKAFTVYRTHHGPVVREEGAKWVSVSLMQKPIEALTQSFFRTKAIDYATFRKVAELQANSSNNTVFADAKGEIAYLHPQFIPRRNDRFDFSHVVDGSDPETDWRGLHPLDDAPHLLDPATGWIQNTNDWPYSAAGSNSPKPEDYPRYMDTFGENPRGIHATKLLGEQNDFTLETLLAAAFDSYMPAFAELIPSLLGAYDRLAVHDPRKLQLAEQIGLLRSWDDRWSSSSVSTTVAIYWGEALDRAVKSEDAVPRPLNVGRLLSATPEAKLDALTNACDKLTADFGTWRIRWGDINRFQRLNDAIDPSFDEREPSIPVPFTPGVWGSLASFSTNQSRTKRRFGTGGNSFVAVVEFGEKVRAKAITAGGESGDPASAHFNDEAVRYSAGALRDVYFYPEQLLGHTERSYHPGL